MKLVSKIKNDIDHFLKIQKLIQVFQNIFIFHHNYPDGDCLGAQFGLKKIIELNFSNKNVFAIGDHENLYSFLKMENDDFLKIKKAFWKNSLAIVVDGDGIKRVKNSKLLIQNCKFNCLLRIDHHNTIGDIKYDHEWINHSYTSVCEQIACMTYYLKWKINCKIAEFLYLGINTDSGRMAYEKTNARTFYVLSWLCENGLNPYKINLSLSNKKINYVRFLGYVWSNFKIEKKLAYCWISQKIIQKYNLNVIEANDANIIGNIKNTNIWAFFIELPNKKIRVRIRSNSIQVEHVLKPFGSNGGHYFSTAGIFSQKTALKIIEHLKEYSTNG